VSSECEWLADTGTNRFVTNDTNDFIRGTVVHSPLTVAVGGGTTISPCSGSVLVFSLDHGITIRCDDVILLPKCAKKLMPAHQFTKKGCTLEFGAGVHLRSKEGAPILSGPQIGGLFYFRAKTIQSEEIPRGEVPLNVTSLFGLPASQNTNNAGADFPRRLLEAHWSFGHLNFDKLRKILGLKKGDDPECRFARFRNRSRQPSLMKLKEFARLGLAIACTWTLVLRQDLITFFRSTSMIVIEFPI